MVPPATNAPPRPIQDAPPTSVPEPDPTALGTGVAAPGTPLDDDVYDPAADPENGWTPGRARAGDVTADQVRRARFRTVGDTGYAQADVDDFLDQVEATLHRWEQDAQEADGSGRNAALDRWPFVRGPQTVSEARRTAPTGLTLVSHGYGYDVREVDAFLEHTAVALELLARGVLPEMTPEMVERTLFHMSPEGGYEQQEVDQLLDQVAAALRQGPAATRPRPRVAPETADATAPPTTADRA